MDPNFQDVAEVTRPDEKKVAKIEPISNSIFLSPVHQSDNDNANVNNANISTIAPNDSISRYGDKNDDLSDFLQHNR